MVDVDDGRESSHILSKTVAVRDLQLAQKNSLQSTRPTRFVPVLDV